MLYSFFESENRTPCCPWDSLPHRLPANVEETKEDQNMVNIVIVKSQSGPSATCPDAACQGSWLCWEGRSTAIDLYIDYYEECDFFFYNMQECLKRKVTEDYDCPKEYRSVFFHFFTLHFSSRKDGGSKWMGRCVFRTRGEGIALACSKPEKSGLSSFPK